MSRIDFVFVLLVVGYVINYGSYCAVINRLKETKIRTIIAEWQEYHHNSDFFLLNADLIDVILIDTRLHFIGIPTRDSCRNTSTGGVLSTLDLDNGQWRHYANASFCNTQTPRKLKAFTLNNKLYLILYNTSARGITMEKLLRWNDRGQQWSTVDGDFPYVLLRPNRGFANIRVHVDQNAAENVAYLGVDSASFDQDSRADFHRLEIDDSDDDQLRANVTVRHVAGITLDSFQQLTFFTANNESILALIRTASRVEPVLLKATFPIDQFRSEFDANSTVNFDGVPGLVDGPGLQLDNVALFFGGIRHVQHRNLFEKVHRICILDLATMQHQDTGVDLDDGAIPIVDPKRRRLLAVDQYLDIKIAEINL